MPKSVTIGAKNVFNTQPTDEKNASFKIFNTLKVAVNCRLKNRSIP